MGGSRMSFTFRSICLLGSLVMVPNQPWAAGAVAVGIAPGGTTHGYAIGIAIDRQTENEAREAAVATCRRQPSNARTQAQCEVVAIFHNQCAASAIDPKNGTSGTGWAAADTQREADAQALARCQNTAGGNRRDFCRVGTRVCDGNAMTIENYSEQIAGDPKDVSAYNGRGNAYYAKGDNDRAIADYNQAIQLDPKDADAYFSRGLAKRRKGDNSGGDADIAAAKTIDPDVGN